MSRLTKSYMQISEIKMSGEIVCSRITLIHNNCSQKLDRTSLEGWYLARIWSFTVYPKSFYIQTTQGDWRPAASNVIAVFANKALPNHIHSEIHQTSPTVGTICKPIWSELPGKSNTEKGLCIYNRNAWVYLYTHCFKEVYIINKY